MFPALLLLSYSAEPTFVRHVPKQPYSEYTCTDRFNRKVHFFLSDGPDKKLPLMAYVQGSGCSSLFGLKDGRLIPLSGHASLYDVIAGHARLIIVEKPGVAFGSMATNVQREGSTEFFEQHTLGRWAEAIESSIKSAQTLPFIDPQLYVLGHSEGGLVAAKVGKDLKADGIGILAGGGPSQLYDLESFARKGYFFSEVSLIPAVRGKYVQDQWKLIEADPESTTKFFLGHPYRRWSSFLHDSPIAELSDYKGRVFIGQGQEDHAVDPTSADQLDKSLRENKVDVTIERVEGADHSFATKDGRSGWTDILTHFAKWAKLI